MYDGLIRCLHYLYLHFSDGSPAHGGVAYREPGDALFGQGAIKHAVRPELLPQSDCATKHASESYVLAKGYLRRVTKSTRKRERLTKQYREIFMLMVSPSGSLLLLILSFFFLGIPLD